MSFAFKGFLLLFGFFFLFAADTAHGAKKALIVAIGDYPSAFGKPLASANDVVLLRKSLLLHGFDEKEIRVLQDKKATSKGIRRAWNQLLKNAASGDILFVHFSGHGVRIPDDDKAEELDGMDEALVPVDAPVNPNPSNYDAFIRDDEVQIFLQRARAKVGKNGHVMMSFDSCYSGTVTRGSEKQRAIAGAQGSTLPGDPDRSGLDNNIHKSENKSEMASFAVISAAANNQTSKEAFVGDMAVGSLSLALSAALGKLKNGDAYHDLYHLVLVELHKHHPRQKPQFEGQLGVEVFNGEAVSQAPYQRITELKGKGYRIDAGFFAGLNEGATIEFHPAGTRKPTENTRIATGTIVKAGAHFSMARPDKEIGHKPGELWAFVKERNLGDYRLRHTTDPNLSAEDKSKISGLFDGSMLISENAQNPDIHISRSQGRWLLESPKSGKKWLMDSLKELKAELIKRAQSNYIRRLELKNPKHKFEAQLLLCTGQGLKDCSPKQKDANGNYVMKEGEKFRIRILNRSKSSLHLSMVGVDGYGEIAQLFPHSELSKVEGTLRKDGQPLVLPGEIPYTVTSATGSELLKIFAYPGQPLSFVQQTSTRGSSNPLTQAMTVQQSTRGSTKRSRSSRLPVDMGYSISIPVITVD